VHLGHLAERRGSADEPVSSPVFRGGQAAADEALERFSVAGYGAGRPMVYPQAKRRSSALSPWIRHGLLSLPRLWDHAAGGPEADVLAFREALLRQEYARHRYARSRPGARPTGGAAGPGHGGGGDDDGWDRRMGCLELTLDELEEDGWLPDPARRWLASHWTQHLGRPWQDGADHAFRHLLDGSRAASRLGWLGIAGPGRHDAHPFTRWQVEEQAPGLCASCELVSDCPIERRVDRDGGAREPLAAGQATMEGEGEDQDPRLDRDPDAGATAGPVSAEDGGRAEVVWLTAESIGDADPALVAHPGLPAVFVFDEPLLSRLRLSAKRLAFLTETLGELATRRPIEVWLGEPVAVLAGRALAATFTPVPGWRRRASRLDLAAVHPWPWLRRPQGGSVRTFARWKEGWRGPYQGRPATMSRLAHAE
jgi:deoxyribodipyrimidine photo-lyase